MPAFNFQKAPVTDDPNVLADWAEAQLENLAADLQSLSLLELVQSYSAPLRPQPGNLIYADGTKYNPGSGEKLYYQSAAGVWVPVASESYVTSAITSGVADIGPFGQCKFSYVDATHSALMPFNGNKLKISGSLYSIPSAGVAVTNSGLAANTLYYAYALQTAGTVSLEFSTTTHATDTTAGNIGVEIKSGAATRSLVGMIYTNGASQFVDSASLRFVRSWFNRVRMGAEGATDTASTDTGVGVYTEKTVSKPEFVCWSDDLIETFVSGVITNSTTAGAVGTILKIDSTDVGLQCDVNPISASARCPVAPSTHGYLSEGHHYVTFGLRALGGGTASASYGMKAQIRVG